MKTKTPTLGMGVAMATNMFGHLRPELKSAIYNFLQFPTHDNWNEIYCIMISNNGKTETVWQAVIALDSSFKFSVPIDDEDNVHWRKVPSAELVSRAILNANITINLN